MGESEINQLITTSGKEKNHDNTIVTTNNNYITIWYLLVQ